METYCFTSHRSVVRPISFVSVRFLRLSSRRSNTWCWPNAGLLLAHRLQPWANIIPWLGYCVVFDAKLNVGQCHRRRANINPALVQSIVPVVQPAWRRPTVKWIMASTGDAGPTFNRHWVDVGLHCQTRSPANTRRCTSAGFTLDQRRRWWARIGPALGQRLVFAGSVDRPHFILHITGCDDIKTVAQLIEPEDDLVMFKCVKN